MALNYRHSGRADICRPITVEITKSWRNSSRRVARQRVRVGETRLQGQEAGTGSAAGPAYEEAGNGNIPRGELDQTLARLIEQQGYTRARKIICNEVGISPSALAQYMKPPPMFAGERTGGEGRPAQL